MEPAAHQVPGAADGGAHPPGDAQADGADGVDGTGGADGPGTELGTNEPRGASETEGPKGSGGDTGTPEDGARTSEAGAGIPEDGAGTYDAAGTPEDDAGTPEDDAGIPEDDAGAPDSAGIPEGEEPAGVAALSLPARIFVAIALAVVTVGIAFHVAMVFFQTAPYNTISKQHAEVIDAYVNPEFERNWKLFAPNPLQQNVAVHARATVAKDNGDTQTTGWVNLSAMDGEAIRGNPAPSHTQQNELRRGWEFYTDNHDEKSRPIGLRGQLSEDYLKRIVMRRFGPELNGGSVERVQVRSAVTPVAPPKWSEERIDVKTQYAVQPWWQVTSADLPGGGK
ncbi:DUF5819 family protein [Streptomyces sp. NBC_01186]|uniref:DUF5819 family protein n=1 Tax=unclassified Streptomyces TaxID=2593676 RepID=UPI002DD7A96A|nr:MULTISPECIES: DUF5819 family protein [unclassified Streptomyces]WSB77955.1 DUF5819 family protein [Streptomyces sp. NBC_01775]WSS13790.1 DUF5819 family protein [Streptomyces sp. NBC_01186]